jgi:transporter family-2 protein
MNGQLKASLGHGLASAWLNFLVGTATLTVAMVVLRVPVPSVSALVSVPWWAWAGGVLGAFFILMNMFAARELGAVSIVVLVLAGQALGSLLVDHLGLMGLPVRPASMTRMVACVLLFVGVVLLQLGDSPSR